MTKLFAVFGTPSLTTNVAFTTLTMLSNLTQPTFKHYQTGKAPIFMLKKKKKNPKLNGVDLVPSLHHPMRPTL